MAAEPRLHHPPTIADAARLLAGHPDSKIVAGGTALVLMHRQGLIQPDHLVSLKNIGDPGFREITMSEGTIRIGSGCTLTEVATHPVVRSAFPALAESCAVVGNIRIRNRATVGGVLAEADYASDPPAVLITLNGVLVIEGVAGTRRLPAAELVLGFFETSLTPDEVITAVEIPLVHGGTAYVKFKSRAAEDRPCVGVAAKVSLERNRVTAVDVVVGAVAATPQRHPGALNAAIGERAGAQLWKQVADAYADAIEPLDDDRGSAWYRTQMIGTHVELALARASAVVS